MRKRGAFAIGVVLIVALFVIGINREPTAVALNAAATLSVSPSAAIVKVSRIGVDLGSWTYYGAEQFSSNVVMNPASSRRSIARS